MVMCTEFVIVNQYILSTLSRHAINILINTLSTVDRHIGQQIVNSQLIFADTIDWIDTWVSRHCQLLTNHQLS